MVVRCVLILLYYTLLQSRKKVLKYAFKIVNIEKYKERNYKLWYETDMIHVNINQLLDCIWLRYVFQHLQKQDHE